MFSNNYASNIAAAVYDTTLTLPEKKLEIL